MAKSTNTNIKIYILTKIKASKWSVEKYSVLGCFIWCHCGDGDVTFLIYMVMAMKLASDDF